MQSRALLGKSRDHARQSHNICTGFSNGTLHEVLTAPRSMLARLGPCDGKAPLPGVLPGITAAGKIKELADAIDAYRGKDLAQGAKQTEAGKLLEAIKTNLPKLTKLRRQVQLRRTRPGRGGRPAWPPSAKRSCSRRTGR
jgi:hypothetical protein